MKDNSFKYYLFTVGAINIPVVVYILFPGVAGIPAAISALFVFMIYMKMQSLGLLKRSPIVKNFKWLLIIVAVGAIHTIVAIDFNRMYITLLLVHLLSWLMICICYMIKDTNSIKYFCNAYLVVLIPTAILSAISWAGFLTFDVLHVLLPLSLFLILSPYFSFVKRIFILFLLITGIAYDSSSRSCLMTLAVCFIIFMMYYILPQKAFRNVLKFARTTFFILPLVFLVLGAFGRFNVFASFESLDVSSFNIDSRKSEGRMLNTDSRSDVYIDVLANINDPVTFFIGQGCVISLRSAWTSDRHSTESEFLNCFLRYGLIGCIIFFILLWKISRNGMKRSNNTLTMLVSVYIAYRFMFTFIEDPGLNPSIFVALGICLNPSIRNMTDEQLKKALR